MDKLIEWGKIEYVCKCGLSITNAKKKSHINNNTCKELQYYGVKNVKGTDKIKCRKCDKLITICGLAAHMITHK